MIRARPGATTSTAARDQRQSQPGAQQPRACRVQLRRTRGYRKPADAVAVTRSSTYWGNPYRLEDYGSDKVIARTRVIELYCKYLRGELEPGAKMSGTIRHGLTGPEMVAKIRRELAGRTLACFCPLDQPCHADVLIRVAAGGEP